MAQNIKDKSNKKGNGNKIVKDNKVVKNSNKLNDKKYAIKVEETKPNKETIAKSKVNKKSKNDSVKLKNKIKKNTNNSAKKSKKKKNIFLIKYSFDFLDLMLIVIVTIIASCVVTGVILNLQYKKYNDFGEAIDDKELSNFVNIYSDIKNNFYEEVDSKEMLDAATKGMINYLGDKYSIYLDDEEADELSQSLKGTYDGMGILVTKNVIIHVYDDSPASKVGLKVDDVIVSVNGTEINDENYSEISANLNTNGKDNEIIVKRDGKEMTFSVKTEEIVLPSVETDIIEKKKKKIGYMAIESFSMTTYDQVSEKLNELEDKGIDSLIIDLRGNTGGYLNVAYDVSCLFLEKGKVVYTLNTKGKEENFEDTTKESRDYSIVILVNGETASAAEMMAATMKENYNAILVGSTTYGKGKVQTFSNYGSTSIKYTFAKWLTPSGVCIDQNGIVPDYEVKNEYKNNTVYDNQKDKAIELLSK